MNEELTCRDVDELLAAYALDALVEEERCAFVTHLAECRLHDDELAAFRAVTSRLPDVIDPVAPPSNLRSGLLSSFDAALRGAETVPVPAATPPARPRLLDVFRKPTFAYGLAAAFLVLALGLGVFGVTGGDDGVQEVTYSAQGQTLKLSYLSKEGIAVIDAQLPSLPSGRVYQAWQMVGGSPVSMGVFSGNGVTALQADLSDATHIAVSVEPSGGSSQPTTTPIIVQEI